MEQWDLSLGPMYADSNVSFVAPAALPNGTPAVLKINVPDLETMFEADALEHWDGERDRRWRQSCCSTPGRLSFRSAGSGSAAGRSSARFSTVPSDICARLGLDQGELAACHQHFHGGNVLLAQRGWLAIDPKPLLGEREFDTASLLRDRRDELAIDPDPRGARPAASRPAVVRPRPRPRPHAGLGRRARPRVGPRRHGLHGTMVDCARWLTSA